MKHRRLHGPRSKREMELDRFRNLPGHIVDKILSHLPIRDAVRTSVLSTAWRYKWAVLPFLDFDERTSPVSAQNEATRVAQLTNVIDHVLLLHFGPVQRFKLASIRLLASYNIDRWVLHLSRRSINEFILEQYFPPEPHPRMFKIPSCLFSCQSLTRLKLTQCIVTLPLAFKGFVNLRSLSFKYVTLSQDGCEKLINTCPLLENLTLWVPNIRKINVDAPNLQSFDLYGNACAVSLQNTLCLEVASIHIRDLEGPMNLLKSLAILPKLRRVEFGENFTECLCLGDLPMKTPELGANIQHFTIAVDFNYLEEILAALDLLQGVPNLQELNVVSGYLMVHEKTTDFWKAANRNCSFTHLRRIKITKIIGRQYETDFIKYMLLASPALESVIITISYECTDKFELSKKLLGFRRASVLAGITLLDS